MIPERLRVFSDAIDWLAHAIAADWSSPDLQTKLGATFQRLTTPAEMRATMIDLGLPRFGLDGFIHPEFTPDQPRLHGAWSL